MAFFMKNNSTYRNHSKTINNSLKPFSPQLMLLLYAYPLFFLTLTTCWHILYVKWNILSFLDM